MSGMVQTGIAVGVDSRGAQLGVREFNAAVNSMPAASRRAVSEIKQQFASVKDSLFSIKGAIAGLGLGLAVRDIINTGLNFNRLHNTLKAASGSSQQAATDYKYLRGEVQRLGLDLTTAGLGFAKLNAAAMGSTLAGDQVKKIFTAVATASTALHLSSEETAGALNAVQQMISKGNVQAEELRGQLGERLPGAFNMAAEAMGVSVQQMNKLLDNGQVLASDLLPRLAILMERKYRNAAMAAADSTQGLINRLSTAASELKDKVFRQMEGSFNDALKTISSLLADPKLMSAAKVIGEDLALGMQYAAKGAIFLAENFKSVVAVIGLLVAGKALTFFYNVGQAVFGIGSAVAGVITKLLAWNATSAATVIANKAVAASEIEVSFSTANTARAYGVQAFTANAAAVANERLALSNAKVAASNMLNGGSSPAGLLGNGVKMLGAGEQSGALVLSNASKSLKTIDAEVVAVGSGMSRLAPLLVNPWVAAAAAIAVVLGSLYIFRDTVLTLNGHTARLRDYLAETFKPELFSGFVDAAKSAAKTIYDAFKDALSAISPLFSSMMQSIESWMQAHGAQLKEAAKGVALNMLGPAGNAFFAFKQMLGMNAEGAETRYNTWRAQQSGAGYLDPMTGARRGGAFDPAAALGVDKFYKSPEAALPPITGAGGKGAFDPNIRKFATELKELQIQIAGERDLKAAIGQNAEAERQAIAARAAAEKINSLGVKTTGAYAMAIRVLTNELSREKAEREAIEQFTKDKQTLTAEIQNTRDLISARKQGAAAVIEVTSAQEANQLLEKTGIFLNEEQRESIKRLVLEKNALKQQEQDYNALLDEGKNLMQQYATPMEQYTAAVAHLKLMRAEDAIGIETYNRALKDLDRQLFENTQNQLRNSRKFSDGAKAIFNDYLDYASNYGAQAQELFSNVFRGFEDTLTDALSRGKFSFKSFFADVDAEITRFVVRSLMGKLFKYLGGILGAQANQGGFFGGLLSAVGFGGSSGGSSTTEMLAYGGIMSGHGSLALRYYANGGIANRPQLAMYGEGSRPEAYVPLPDGRSIPVTMNAGAAARPVVVTAHFHGVTNVNEFNESRDQIAAQLGAGIGRAMRRNG